MPALGTESPTAAFAARPHVWNCTDEGEPSPSCVRPGPGPRPCGAPSPHWARLWLQMWESLILAHPLGVSRALFWGV